MKTHSRAHTASPRIGNSDFFEYQDIFINTKSGAIGRRSLKIKIRIFMMAGGVADLLHVFCDASNWCFQTVIELSTALFYYTKREGINFVAVKYDEIIAGVYYLSISLRVCVFVFLLFIYAYNRTHSFLLPQWCPEEWGWHIIHTRMSINTCERTRLHTSNIHACAPALVVATSLMHLLKLSPSLLHPTISLFRVNTTWLTGVTMWPSDAEPLSWLIQWEMLVLLYTKQDE